ncbi:M50 family metallopeptidase [Tenacibaculum sp.]|nr:M50 family metallopeptidase [Tenacibaculum sp.]
MNNSKRLDYTILGIALAVFLLLQIPYFRWLQYPFRLLGTWFHEMGHGLTALCIGGNFKYLEIYKNGGGVAYYSITDRYLSLSTSKAIVAAGGLLGPAITGAIFIAAAKFQKSAVILLRVLTGVIILSLILWVRSSWGVIVMGIFAVLLIIITLIKSRKTETITILFLGLQATLSTYLQLDYLFTKQFHRDGAIRISDTQSIAENTIGTYWLWGVFIIIISAFILWKSIRFYFKR